jgi:DNA-binding transcriptional LysR family regulator
MGRDLPTVVTSLLRGEIDAGFGRVHPSGVPGEDALRHRLVRLEPVDVVIGTNHPLAGADEVRPAQLRGGFLWAPAAPRSWTSCASSRTTSAWPPSRA